MRFIKSYHKAAVSTKCKRKGIGTRLRDLLKKKKKIAGETPVVKAAFSVDIVFLFYGEVGNHLLCSAWLMQWLPPLRTGLTL